MSEENQDKLNSLQRALPEGLIADTKWLGKLGYSGALLNKYVARRWLERVARGVYRRPTPKLQKEPGKESLRWQQVVISLQTLLGCPYTVGGRTALELQGFAHYLSSGRDLEIHLYGTGKPPGWVSKLELGNRFVFHNTERLFRAEAGRLHRRKAGERSENRVLQGSTIQQSWGQWEWPLKMSSPERASLELMDEVPQRETFHQADVLMEGLRNLSPQRLHALLVACRNVKVKRLFLWFAERHAHPWLKKLDSRDIDLGHGKRVLVRGGKLDKTFNITVPESVDAAG